MNRLVGMSLGGLVGMVIAFCFIAFVERGSFIGLVGALALGHLTFAYGPVEPEKT